MIMKTAALFLLFVYINYATYAKEHDCPLKALLRNSSRECKETLNVDKEHIRQFFSAEGNSDDRDVKCFFACVYNTSGLMENAKFDIDVAERILNSAAEPNVQKINKKLTKLKNCKQEAEISDDECEVSANFVKCLKLKKRNKNFNKESQEEV